MSWKEPTHSPNGVTLFSSTKVSGRQKTILMINITQVNVKNKKQMAYLNLKGNLSIFSNFRFVETFNIY